MRTTKFLFGTMLLACAMMVASCNKKDNPDDPFGPTPDNGNGGNGGGTTTTTELTVAEAIAQQGTTGVTVKGYVVGWYNNHKNASKIEFGNEATADTTVIATNIVIADKADETNSANCLCIQLPVGKVRSLANLKDNPANLHCAITLKGDLAKYNTMAGLKNTSYVAINGKTSEDKATIEVSEAITCAEASNYVGQEKVVAGYVLSLGTNKSGETYSYGQQWLFMADTPDATESTFQAYWCNIDESAQAVVGDKVYVKGKIIQYGTTYEIKNGDMIKE